MSNFEKAWNVVKEDEPPLDPNGNPSFYMNYSDSVDRIRDKTWEKGMGEISIPMRDRDNPNPHPLDGMLDDSFISANNAYTVWDEGYEPDYNPVIEAAKGVLEAMGYQIIPPNDEEMEDGDEDWERENRDNLEPNKEMKSMREFGEVFMNKDKADEWHDWYDKRGEKNE